MTDSIQNNSENVKCYHIVSGTAPPYVSELLHLYSPSRSLHSAADTRIFRVARMGPRGRDPYNTLDLCSGTPFLSLSGIRLHSLLLSQNWKHISSPLHTDLSFYQSITSNACICSVCVCLAVCVCVSGCVCACDEMYPYPSFHVFVVTNICCDKNILSWQKWKIVLVAAPASDRGQAVIN